MIILTSNGLSSKELLESTREKIKNCAKAVIVTTASVGYKEKDKQYFDRTIQGQAERISHQRGKSMQIREINENKEQYMNLLLLADEQEDMIDRYLDRGTMYVLDDNGVKAECVVTNEGNGILEIKNIATLPEYQKRGYARKLIDFLVAEYSEQFSVLQVGTGDSPLTIPFYEKCGFIRSYVVKDFFINNYKHPIFECGKQLIDMVYLQRTLKFHFDKPSQN